MTIYSNKRCHRTNRMGCHLHKQPLVDMICRRFSSLSSSTTIYIAAFVPHCSYVAKLFTYEQRFCNGHVKQQNSLKEMGYGTEETATSRYHTGRRRNYRPQPARCLSPTHAGMLRVPTRGGHALAILCALWHTVGDPLSWLWEPLTAGRCGGVFALWAENSADQSGRSVNRVLGLYPFGWFPAWCGRSWLDRLRKNRGNRRRTGRL